MYLDLDKLLEANETIYVKNSTKPKGKYIVTFSDPNSGASRPFMVPKTWVPINVSQAIPRKVIEASMDFRNALAKGTLTLIQASEAEKMLSEPDAQDELKRLNQSEFASASKFAGQRAKDLLEATEAKAEQSAFHAEKMKVDDELSAKEKVNPAVLDLCMRVNGKGLDVKSALNEYRCIEEDLTADDCAYVIANCDGHIRTWAKTLMEKLQSSPAELQE